MELTQRRAGMVVRDAQPERNGFLRFARPVQDNGAGKRQFVDTGYISFGQNGEQSAEGSRRSDTGFTVISILGRGDEPRADLNRQER